MMNAVIDVDKALANAGVVRKKGLVRGVQDVGTKIGESRDPLATANAVIASLGGQAEADAPTARIKAKALVVEALENKDFDPAIASAKAEKKVKDLKKSDGYLFVQDEAATATPKKRGRPASGSKKADAKAIYDANKGLTDGEIAQTIAKKLGITYSNAYYYCTRVFRDAVSKAS